MSPKAKELCHVRTQLARGQSCRRQRNLASVYAEPLRSCPALGGPIDWAARSLRQGDSRGKNTGAYWPVLVAIPFESTIFPAALAANSPGYLVLPEPL